MKIPAAIKRRALEELTNFCDRRVPLRARDQVRLEVSFRGTDATIFELRAPWRTGIGSEWSRRPIAQFRYLDRGWWSLHWPNRNDRWFPDEQTPLSQSIEDLIEEVDEDPTGAYWG